MEMEEFSNQDIWWKQRLLDRNLTTHIYDDEIIIKVLNDIFECYFSFFFRIFAFFLKQRQMNRVLWQQYGLNEINGKRIIDVFFRFSEIQEAVLPYFVDIVVSDCAKSMALKEHTDKFGKTIYQQL
ncbi:hypothetical protein [Bacteroides rodentium]